MIKRLTSVIIVCTLLSCFLMIPAYAAGTLPLRVELYYNNRASLSGSYATGVVTKNLNVKDASIDLGTPYKFSFRSAYFRNAQEFVGTMGIYVSFYYATSNIGSSFPLESTDPAASQFVVGSQGQSTKIWSYQPLSGFDTFQPSMSDEFCSRGVVLKGRVESTADYPNSIVDIQVDPDFLNDPKFYAVVQAYQGGSTSYIYYPSVQLVDAQNDAILDQMEGIANSIAQQNEILSAMYGDIMQVLNSIYARTGDLLEAQNLTNQYFSSIIPLLEAIKSTTNNIYTLLSQQFALLISTIQSESDDIQATINAAIDKMIAYLDNAFNSAVNPALPGTSQDITTNNGTVNDAESDYQSTALDRFNSISADFAGFDGSILSGVALGGSLFQRIWNVLGDYVILYTFPLTLSICLVVVGRLSRNASRSGGSKKKDGDDS